jgi:hypothetical protein
MAKLGGPKEACVCGQTISLCQRHHDYRTAGRYVYARGHYQRMHSYHGFQNHGRSSTFVPVDQIADLRQTELGNMLHGTGGLEHVSDTDEEGDPPASNVRFGETILPSEAFTATPPLALAIPACWCRTYQDLLSISRSHERPEEEGYRQADRCSLRGTSNGPIFGSYDGSAW